MPKNPALPKLEENDRWLIRKNVNTPAHQYVNQLTVRELSKSGKYVLIEINYGGKFPESVYWINIEEIFQRYVFVEELDPQMPD